MVTLKWLIFGPLLSTLAEVKEQWFKRGGGWELGYITHLKSTAMRCSRKLAYSSSHRDRLNCLITRKWWEIENWVPGKESKAFSVFPFASKRSQMKTERLKSWGRFSLHKQALFCTFPPASLKWDVRLPQHRIHLPHKEYIPTWQEWTGVTGCFLLPSDNTADSNIFLYP